MEKLIDVLQKPTKIQSTRFPSGVVFVIFQLILQHEIASARLAFSLLFKAVEMCSTKKIKFSFLYDRKRQVKYDCSYDGATEHYK